MEDKQFEKAIREFYGPNIPENENDAGVLITIAELRKIWNAAKRLSDDDYNEVVMLVAEQNGIIETLNKMVELITKGLGRMQSRR